MASARAPAHATAVDELSGVSLPLPLTALLGRETDLQTLRHWLADPAARLITLIGPGGVGKTRLALELARQSPPRARPRACSSRWPRFGTGVRRLGDRRGSRPGGHHRARFAEARTGRVRDKPTLLVLDNFEQVLEAAPLVADLLTSVASLRVLVTSRAPLRVRGEREYAVGPLALEADSTRCRPPIWRALPRCGSSWNGCGTCSPTFASRREWPHRDGDLSSARCPAARARAGGPVDQGAHGRGSAPPTRGDVLPSTAGPRDLPERQQTMNATVAWSYQLLDPDEQRAFRRLGALPGPFPIDAAAAVLAGRDGCGRRERRSAPRGGRLDRQEPSAASRDLGGADVSAVPDARDGAGVRGPRTGAAGERDDAMEGLARYCTAEAPSPPTGLVGPAQVEWLDRVREDLESYRGALAWLIERGRPAEASDIAWGLMFFWLIRGHAAEGLRWYEQASEPAAASDRRRVESAARGGGDVVHARTTRSVHAPRSRAPSRSPRCRRQGDGRSGREPVSGTSNMLLAIWTPPATGSPAVLKGSGQLANPWGTGQRLSGMAWVALATGDAGQAERLLDEATSVLRHAGPWFLSLVSYLRAILAVRRGNPDEAIALVRESLTRYPASSMTRLHSCTRWFLSPPRRHSRATTNGRRGSWARGTSSPKRTGATVVERSRTSSGTGRNEMHVHASAPIGGPWRTRPAAGALSIRCSRTSMLSCREERPPIEFTLTRLSPPPMSRSRHQSRHDGFVPRLMRDRAQRRLDDNAADRRRDDGLISTTNLHRQADPNPADSEAAPGAAGTIEVRRRRIGKIRAALNVTSSPSAIATRDKEFIVRTRRVVKGGRLRRCTPSTPFTTSTNRSSVAA